MDKDGCHENRINKARVLTLVDFMSKRIVTDTVEHFIMKKSHLSGR